MEHHVRKKLDQIVPYLIAGKRLPTQAHCRAQRVFAFLNDFIAVFAGLGLPPTIGAIAGAFGAEPASGNPGGAGEDGGLWTALKGVPPWVAVATILLLVAWLGVKLYLKQANAAEKTALADNVEKQIAVHESTLDGILSQPEPMPELVILQGKLQELRQTSITSDVWPWRPLPTDEAFKSECSRVVGEWCSQYAGHWSPAPQNPELRAA